MYLDTAVSHTLHFPAIEDLTVLLHAGADDSHAACIFHWFYARLPFHGTCHIWKNRATSYWHYLETQLAPWCLYGCDTEILNVQLWCTFSIWNLHIHTFFPTQLLWALWKLVSRKGSTFPSQFWQPWLDCMLLLPVEIMISVHIVALMISTGMLHTISQKNAPAPASCLWEARVGQNLQRNPSGRAAC